MKRLINELALFVASIYLGGFLFLTKDYLSNESLIALEKIATELRDAKVRS